MEYDEDKVDEAVLALLYLTASRDQSGVRAELTLHFLPLALFDRIQKFVAHAVTVLPSL